MASGARCGSGVIAPGAAAQVTDGRVDEQAACRAMRESRREYDCRPIAEVLPVPPLPAPLRALIEWTADDYLLSPSPAWRGWRSPVAGALGGACDT